MKIYLIDRVELVKNHLVKYYTIVIERIINTLSFQDFSQTFCTANSTKCLKI